MLFDSIERIYVRRKEVLEKGRKEEKSDIAPLLWLLGIVPKIGLSVMRQTGGFLLLLPFHILRISSSFFSANTTVFSANSSIQ